MARRFPILLLYRIAAALTLLWCTTTLALADPGRRVALVIGNGAYQNAPALPNPPNDAKAVAEALRGLDFEVIEAVDLDQPDMLAKVDEFSAKLEGADTGLFFYAGHGLQVGGENYLVPIDARLQREAQVRLQTLPLQTVLATMEAAVATRIVLLDACRDNPLAQQLKRSMAVSRSSVVGQGLAEVRTAVGTLIAYATGPGDVASDGDGAHSPFTGALLDHIATPGLEVRQVLGRVRDEVLKQTGERQVPWDSSSLRGEFYFRLLPPTVAALSDATSPVTPGATGYQGRDREAFEVIAESQRGRDFAIFLERYPESTLAPFVQSRLDELTSLDGAILDLRSESSSAVSAPAVAAINPDTVGRATTPPQAKNRLDAASPPSAIVEIPELPAAEAGLSLSREDWRLLQQSLTALGFDTGSLDGRPGPLTRKALASWQKARKHDTTGQLNEDQRNAILREHSDTASQLAKVDSSNIQREMNESILKREMKIVNDTIYNYVEIQTSRFYEDWNSTITGSAKPYFFISLVYLASDKADCHRRLKVRFMKSFAAISYAPWVEHQVNVCTESELQLSRILARK